MRPQDYDYLVVEVTKRPVGLMCQQAIEREAQAGWEHYDSVPEPGGGGVHGFYVFLFFRRPKEKPKNPTPD